MGSVGSVKAKGYRSWEHLIIVVNGLLVGVDLYPNSISNFPGYVELESSDIVWYRRCVLAVHENFDRAFRIWRWSNGAGQDYDWSGCSYEGQI